MAKFSTNGITLEYNADRRGEVLAALENAKQRGLQYCGERAVKHAQDKVPVDTGNLRNSITYAVDGDDCYIGTNVEYAPYIEFGTGKFAEHGGRQTPWTYPVIDSSGETKWYFTEGMKPQPYLRPAASEHTKEYIEILKDSLMNA